MAPPASAGGLAVVKLAGPRALAPPPAPARHLRHRLPPPPAAVASQGQSRGSGAPPGRPPRMAPNLGARSPRGTQPPRERRAGPEREPFDAELLVLFGLPALVLLIAFAFNEPKSLAVAIPLALLIPGPRDVLLHMAADFLRGAARARRFVSYDADDFVEGARSTADVRVAREAYREARWRRQRGAASGAAPPPPPPPPPTVEYELRAGEYDVYAPPPPPEPQPTAGQPRFQQQPQQHFQQRQQHPRSPFADGWPAAAAQQPRSPFADGWPAAAAPPRSPPHLGRRQPAQPAPRSPFADGWPPVQASSGGGGASWGPPGSSGRPRRAGRGGGPTAAAGRRQPAGRLARPAGQGSVGVDLPRRERDTTPLLLRPLFALVPFLRHWGGFL